MVAGPMVYSLEHIRCLSATLVAQRPMPWSSFGRMVCGNWNSFERIMRGGGCQAATAEEITRWFDENWPADLNWPKGVPRNPRRPPRQEGRGADATAAAAA